MQHVKQKDGGDGTPFPPGALLRADSHRLLAGRIESLRIRSSRRGSPVIHDGLHGELTEIKAPPHARGAYPVTLIYAAE